MAASAPRPRADSPEHSPPPKDSAAADKKHMRTYQACVHCRKRKVKCELGDTENPQPPCARCTREQKQCTFTEERRRKRPGESDHTSLDGNESEGENIPVDPVIVHKRQKLAAASRTFSGQSLNLASPPIRRSTGSEMLLDEEEDPHISARSASLIQAGDVFSQNDALQLLYKAAQHHHNRTNSTSSATAVPLSTETSPASHATSPNGVFMPGLEGRPQSQNQPPPTDPMQDAREIALQTWSRFRFVRAGWIKAEEGIAYVEYFYKNLYPLTPITVPDYSHPSTHKELLESEPILALALLAITSRYMNPPGPGSTSRGPIIHDTLTISLQKEINRTVWGQKQFGGGFCRAGANTKGNVNHLWQTLGTIEALMLLTEWHPRSLHFPPGDDDGELLNPEDPHRQQNTSTDDAPITLGGPEGRRVDAWLEPCWRSDRMCWMLLNIATGLSYEIGVFDETAEHEFKANNPELSDEKIRSYFRRKNYLKDLLPIYNAVTSGRLELTKNIPRSYLDHLKETRQERLDDRLIKLGFDLAGRNAGTSYMARLKMLDNHPQDLVIHLWQEISCIMNSGNKNMYPNRKHTAELVQSGQYVKLLQFYQPMLNDWHRDFTSCKSIPQHMRHILLIEYHYCRAFLYLLALHAVFSRCTRNTPMNKLAQLAEYARDASDPAKSPNLSNSDSAIPPNDIRKWMGVDSPYISEVVDACRQIFKIVTDGLLPDEYLKRCPVRTYFRIISAALILLKTFVVGATENEMAISLGMMDNAVFALHGCIVDDVHVGNRFADMCQDLSRRIRQSFVRMSATGGSGISRADTPPMARGSGSLQPTASSLPVPGAPISGASFSPAPFQWPSLGSTTPTIGTAATNNAAADALNQHVWGASKNVYDPSSSNMAILPAPNVYYSQFDNGFDFKQHTPNVAFSGSATGPVGATAFPDIGVDGASDIPFSSDFYNGINIPPDWLTLPFDGLLNSGNEVIATANGPAFGPDDMLDRLLGTAGGG